jgi:hypothetical protein
MITGLFFRCNCSTVFAVTVAVAFIIAALQRPVYAQMYSCTSKSGKVHFSNLISDRSCVPYTPKKENPGR